MNRFSRKCTHARCVYLYQLCLHKISIVLQLCIWKYSCQNVHSWCRQLLQMRGGSDGNHASEHTCKLKLRAMGRVLWMSVTVQLAYTPKAELHRSINTYMKSSRYFLLLGKVPMIGNQQMNWTLNNPILLFFFKKKKGGEIKILWLFRRQC